MIYRVEEGTLDESRHDALTEKIIGAAIAVHRELGPGLLESTYEVCLAHELTHSGMSVEKQKDLPVQYQGVKLECGYRIDLLVNGEIIIELKTVEKLMPIHHAQLITYLKLSGCRIGLLINFNELRLKDGVRRIAV